MKSLLSDRCSSRHVVSLLSFVSPARQTKTLRASTQWVTRKLRAGSRGTGGRPGICWIPLRIAGRGLLPEADSSHPRLVQGSRRERTGSLSSMSYDGQTRDGEMKATPLSPRVARKRALQYATLPKGSVLHCFPRMPPRIPPLGPCGTVSILMLRRAGQGSRPRHLKLAGLISVPSRKRARGPSATWIGGDLMAEAKAVGGTTALLAKIHSVSDKDPNLEQYAALKQLWDTVTEDEDYQRYFFYGATTAERIEAKIHTLDIDTVPDADLTGPIHPFLARHRWGVVPGWGTEKEQPRYLYNLLGQRGEYDLGTNDLLWAALQPALQLASRIISSDHPFWLALLDLYFATIDLSLRDWPSARPNPYKSDDKIILLDPPLPVDSFCRPIVMPEAGDLFQVGFWTVKFPKYGHRSLRLGRSGLGFTVVHRSYHFYADELPDLLGDSANNWLREAGEKLAAAGHAIVNHYLLFLAQDIARPTAVERRWLHQAKQWPLYDERVRELQEAVEEESDKVRKVWERLSDGDNAHMLKPGAAELYETAEQLIYAVTDLSEYFMLRIGEYQHMTLEYLQMQPGVRTVLYLNYGQKLWDRLRHVYDLAAAGALRMLNTHYERMHQLGLASESVAEGFGAAISAIKQAQDLFADIKGYFDLDGDIAEAKFRS
ncbi:hypothetical protein B0H67DRAFT_679569 [Lasiosphaeris hirsuta]|uniref:Uncharacterized protein n=1 Tax=Lasiosphaeris hirsuta TaxID=260670 RepID=A0AA40EBG2_9PEZI|nr:hypothetical protein B0H67DRAFT_679569 [Lasiosphaeris hirsuta]